MTDYKVIFDPADRHPFALVAASSEFIFLTGLASPGDTAAQQARGTIEQMSGLLERVGSSLAEIVYFRPLITKREYLPEVDAVLREMLPDPKPASGALVICELAAPELKVEFEAIAQRGARMVVEDDSR